MGRHALYFQEQFETVAIEVNDHLVETMRDRGVADARKADMFTLRNPCERGRVVGPNDLLLTVAEAVDDERAEPESRKIE